MKNTKDTPKMTIAEAIEKGYTRFIEDGQDYARKLSDGFDEEELKKIEDFSTYPGWQNYWLIDKEPTHYRFSEEQLTDVLEDYVINQEEFGDEDGMLADCVAEVFKEKPELFNALTEALNEKFKSINFHNPLDILIVP